MTFLFLLIKIKGQSRFGDLVSEVDFVDTPRNCEAGISIILFFPAVPLRSLMELLSRLELPNLFITNEVLYRLSYSSTPIYIMVLYFKDSVN